MDRDIRNKLIELARQKTTWSYKQLNQQLFLGFDFQLKDHHEKIGEILAKISLHEHSRKRPLLSALIKHSSYTEKKKDRNFVKLCESIYGIGWEQLKADPAFEQERIKECIDFWKEDDKYHAHKNDY